MTEPDERYEAEVARAKELMATWDWPLIKITRHPAMELGRQVHELILGNWGGVIDNQ